MILRRPLHVSEKCSGRRREPLVLRSSNSSRTSTARMLNAPRPMLISSPRITPTPIYWSLVLTLNSPWPRSQVHSWTDLGFRLFGENEVDSTGMGRLVSGI